MERFDYTSASGAILGSRYRLDRRLDAGGMAAVYGAEDMRLGRRVAVKLLHKHIAEDAEHLERFRREALVTASVHHPNIVHVLDFETAGDGPPYIVMELLEGEPISHRVRRAGPLTIPDAGSTALQLLSALAVAHAAGVTHRDLKPGNVFLVPLSDGTDLVKVLDFGIASVKVGPGFDRLTQTGIVLGTPATMAPEQARGERTDPRTDLYAVGIVLYFALAGRFPFESENLTELITKVILSPPPPITTLRRDTPPALAGVIARALAKPQGERFASAEAMAAAIRDAMQLTPTPRARSAPRPETTGPTQPSTTRPDRPHAMQSALDPRATTDREPVPAVAFVSTTEPDVLPRVEPPHEATLSHPNLAAFASSPPARPVSSPSTSSPSVRSARTPSSGAPSAKTPIPPTIGTAQPRPKILEAPTPAPAPSGRGARIALIAIALLLALVVAALVGALLVRVLWAPRGAGTVPTMPPVAPPQTPLVTPVMHANDAGLDDAGGRDAGGAVEHGGASPAMVPDERERSAHGRQSTVAPHGPATPTIRAAGSSTDPSEVDPAFPTWTRATVRARADSSTNTAGLAQIGHTLFVEAQQGRRCFSGITRAMALEVRVELRVTTRGAAELVSARGRDSDGNSEDLTRVRQCLGSTFARLSYPTAASEYRAVLVVTARFPGPG